MNLEHLGFKVVEGAGANLGAGAGPGGSPNPDPVEIDYSKIDYSKIDRSKAVSVLTDGKIGDIESLNTILGEIDKPRTVAYSFADERLAMANEYIKNGGSYEEFQALMSFPETPEDAFSPSELVMLDLKKNNPGLSDQSIQRLFEKEYSPADPEDEGEVNLKKELLSVKAKEVANALKGRKQELAKYKPEPPAPEMSPAEIAAKRAADKKAFQEKLFEFKGFEVTLDKEGKEKYSFTVDESERASVFGDVSENPEAAIMARWSKEVEGKKVFDIESFAKDMYLLKNFEKAASTLFDYGITKGIEKVARDGDPTRLTMTGSPAGSQGPKSFGQQIAEQAASFGLKIR